MRIFFIKPVFVHIPRIGMRTGRRIGVVEPEVDLRPQMRGRGGRRQHAYNEEVKEKKTKTNLIFEFRAHRVLVFV